MTIEKTRLTQTLGMPDLKLKEIVEEQRLLDAASRWPILDDLVKGYEPARREISVSLNKEAPEAKKEAEGVIRLKTKSKRNRGLFGGEVAETPAPAAESAEDVPTHQLSNVFLRLKHREKQAPRPKPDSKLVTV